MTSPAFSYFDTFENYKNVETTIAAPVTYDFTDTTTGIGRAARFLRITVDTDVTVTLNDVAHDAITLVTGKTHEFSASTDGLRISNITITPSGSTAITLFAN